MRNAPIYRGRSSGKRPTINGYLTLLLWETPVVGDINCRIYGAEKYVPSYSEQQLAITNPLGVGPPP